jgi:hypothetical protein
MARKNETILAGLEFNWQNETPGHIQPWHNPSSYN